MSVKPIVATPELLPKFTLKDFKSKFFPAVKKLAKKHNSQESPVPFFLSTDNKYPEGEGFFMAFGKMAKWKKHAKDNVLKQDALRGYCFVEANENGGLVLKLMPVAGKLKAKESLIEKELKKIISASKLQLDILKGDFVDNDDLEAAIEKMEESNEVETEEAEEVEEVEVEETESSKTIPTPQDLANSVKTIGEQFKTLRDGDHNSEELKSVYKQILKWQKHFELQAEPIKTKLAAHAEQMKKLMEAAQQMLKVEHVLEQDIDKILDLITQFVEKYSDSLLEQILSALKSAEKLAKSLSADSILNQIEELKTMLGE